MSYRECSGVNWLDDEMQVRLGEVKEEVWQCNFTSQYFNSVGQTEYIHNAHQAAQERDSQYSEG